MTFQFGFDGNKYREASKHQKEWGNKLISELNLRGDEVVLDLGCGDGVLTRELARLLPKGEVLGLDASPGMIEAAGQIQESNLSFALLNVNEMEFVGKYDLIFSNAALHWVKDHADLLKRCKKALKTGGQISWSFGGFGNCANLNEVLMSSMAEPGFKGLFTGFEWPWYMPSESEYAALLQAVGFAEFEILLENTDRNFKDKETMIKWIDQPCIVPFLEYLEEPEKQGFRDMVVAKMLEKTAVSDGTYFETFRRLNVSAVKR